jgi:hypothetical protein
MKLATQIALALLLTSASAFAEEPQTANTDGELADDTVVVESDATAEVAITSNEVELASTGTSASSSETVSVSPAPWSETMSSMRTGGVPEGTTSPNELHSISWSNNHLVIGAGALIVILLIIILVA